MVYSPATKVVSYEDTSHATTSDIRVVTDQEATSNFLGEIISHPDPLLGNVVESDTEHLDIQADVEVGK